MNREPAILKTIALPLLLSVLLIHSASAQMYRSVDANGKVVYSDASSASDKSKGSMVRVAPAPEPVSLPQENTDGGQDKRRKQDAEETQRKQALLAKAMADKACRSAQERMKLLEFAEGNRLALRSASGDLTYVSDEERSAAAAAARQTMARNCR